MKTLLFVLCITATIVLLSCKKEYICECAVTTIMWDDTTYSNYSASFTAKNDKEARGDCEGESSQDLMGMKTITKCWIK